MENWKSELTKNILSDLDYRRWRRWISIKNQEEENKKEDIQYEKTYGFEKAYRIFKEKYPNSKVGRKEFYLKAIDMLESFSNPIGLSIPSEESTKIRLNQEMLEHLFCEEDAKSNHVDISEYMEEIKGDQLKKIKERIKSEKILSKEVEKKKTERDKEKRNVRLKCIKVKIKRVNKYYNDTMQKISEEYNERNFGCRLEETGATFHSIINEYAAAVGVKYPFNQVNKENPKIGFRKKTKEFFWKLVDCAYGNSVTSENISEAEMKEYGKCRNEVEIEDADPRIRQEILWEFIDHIAWKLTMQQKVEKKSKKKKRKTKAIKFTVTIKKDLRETRETMESLLSFIQIFNNDAIVKSYSYTKIIKYIEIAIRDLGNKLLVENKKIEDSWNNLDNELKKIKKYQSNLKESVKDYFLQPEYLNILNRKIYIAITEIYQKVLVEKEKLLQKEDNCKRDKEIFGIFIDDIYKKIKSQLIDIRKYGKVFLDLCIRDIDINITELICYSNFLRMLFTVCMIFSEKSEDFIDKIEAYDEEMRNKVENIRSDPESKDQQSIGWYKNFSSKLKKISDLEEKMYREDEELMVLLIKSNEFIDAVVAAIEHKILWVLTG